MTKSITILTSRLNYGWVSMEEIITWIEDSWKNWARERNVNCQVFMAENTDLNEFLKAGIKSDFIVVTCFNLPVARSLNFLRVKFGIQVPWVYYLHGLASYGCWPLFQWGIGDCLTTHDLFIGSCSRDKKQFDLIFKNIECQIIPFSLDFKKPIPDRGSSEVIRLAFIGRISSQKNLHTLLVAASQVRKKFELHFFGKADDYGSPLMGRREKNYQEYLEKLSVELGLKNVFFHGFVKREEIERMMDSDLWTFIAPSIHSDENFGMAAFRCLLNGHNVILSDWGGHADYPDRFPTQVQLAPVRSSEIGPYISVNDLVGAIEATGKDGNKGHPETMPAYYSEVSIHRRFDDITERMRTKKTLTSEAVVTHSLLGKIMAKRTDYMARSENPEGIRIFEDYTDKNLEAFYKAYGMQSLPEKRKGQTKLVPWVTQSPGGYTVADPHRGNMELPGDVDLVKTGLAYFPAVFDPSKDG